MKSQYAIFDQSGNFVRFEALDPATLPPIPLAADGQPRAVPTGPAPTISDAQALTYSRAGWVTIERDAVIVAAEGLARTEREEARAAIEQIATIAQTPITTVAQASAAIRQTARAVRWLLRQSIQS